MDWQRLYASKVVDAQEAMAPGFVTGVLEELPLIPVRVENPSSLQLFDVGSLFAVRHPAEAILHAAVRIHGPSRLNGFFIRVQEQEAGIGLGVPGFYEEAGHVIAAGRQRVIGRAISR